MPETPNINLAGKLVLIVHRNPDIAAGHVEYVRDRRGEARIAPSEMAALETLQSRNHGIAAVYFDSRLIDCDAAIDLLETQVSSEPRRWFA